MGLFESPILEMGRTFTMYKILCHLVFIFSVTHDIGQSIFLPKLTIYFIPGNSQQVFNKSLLESKAPVHTVNKQNHNQPMPWSWKPDMHCTSPVCEYTFVWLTFCFISKHSKSVDYLFGQPWSAVVGPVGAYSQVQVASDFSLDVLKFAWSHYLYTHSLGLEKRSTNLWLISWLLLARQRKLFWTKIVWSLA